MSDAFDDLIAAAKARAESGGADPSWGELLELDEEESFEGRYRGSTTDPKHNRPVWLFWGAEGELYWSRSYAALDRELDAAGPSVGDRIAIYRGANYKTDYDTEESGPKGRSFGVVCEPSDEPLPAGAAPEPADDDIPF